MSIYPSEQEPIIPQKQSEEYVGKLKQYPVKGDYQGVVRQGQEAASQMGYGQPQNSSIFGELVKRASEGFGAQGGIRGPMGPVRWGGPGGGAAGQAALEQQWSQNGQMGNAPSLDPSMLSNRRPPMTTQFGYKGGGLLGAFGQGTLKNASDY